MRVSKFGISKIPGVPPFSGAKNVSFREGRCLGWKKGGKNSWDSWMIYPPERSHIPSDDFSCFPVWWDMFPRSPWHWITSCNIPSWMRKPVIILRTNRKNGIFLYQFLKKPPDFYTNSLRIPPESTSWVYHLGWVPTNPQQVGPIFSQKKTIRWGWRSINPRSIFPPVLNLEHWNPGICWSGLYV